MAATMIPSQAVPIRTIAFPPVAFCPPAKLRTATGTRHRGGMKYMYDNRHGKSDIRY